MSALDLDLVVANGTVVDGTGAAPFRADIGVRGGRIEVVARGRALTGARVLDAAGLVVAPGFVDVDSHADWAVAQGGAAPLLARWLRQGVTTVVGGACGFSPAPVLPGCAGVVARLTGFLRDEPFVPRWSSFGEFLDAVESAGVPLNVGFLVGEVTLRAQAAGGAPPAAQVRRVVVEQVREALRAGALGVAAHAGLASDVAESRGELAVLAEVAAQEGGLFAVHARAYTTVSAAYRPLPPRGPHNVQALRELVEIGRESEAALHVLHLMAVGRRTWRTCDEVLECLDAARAEGVDVGFDASPYTVSVGPIQLLFPDRFVSRVSESGRPRGTRALKLLGVLQRALLGMGPDDVRLRSAGADPALVALEGRSFAEIARRLGTSAFDAEVDVALRGGMTGASVLIGTASGDAEDETALRAFLSHPLCAIGTNAASTRAGPQNPSATGAFPRVLGRYVRDLGVLTLEEAVRRMTSLPAARLGLAGIGRVAEGCRADLVLLDAAAIRDPADPERPDATPQGIRWVVVSGVPVVDDGRVVDGVRPGRVLRRRAA